MSWVAMRSTNKQEDIILYNVYAITPSSEDHGIRSDKPVDPDGHETSLPISVSVCVVRQQKCRHRNQIRLEHIHFVCCQLDGRSIESDEKHRSEQGNRLQFLFDRLWINLH